MTAETSNKLAEPRIMDRNALLLAGLSRTYAGGNNAGRPSQWQEFVPRIGSVPGQIGKTTFGVVYNMDDEDNHEYLCAVEVASFDGLTEDFTRLRLSEHSYAVFRHDRHVSETQLYFLVTPPSPLSEGRI